jgi:hypothetical protein
MNTLTMLTTSNSKFVITPTGIQFNEELSYDEWIQMANDLGRAERSIGFVIGDWINYGESRWREKYDEALKITRLSRQTSHERSNRPDVGTIWISLSTRP